MRLYKILPSLCFFILLSGKLRAQVETKIISGEKPCYEINDEFSIQIQLTVDPRSCQDGMEKTGIYPAGLHISSKSDWLELRKGLWQVVLKCKVTGNKKGFGQLTIVRKNDKQDLFKQIKFNIRKNVDITRE